MAPEQTPVEAPAEDMAGTPMTEAPMEDTPMEETADTPEMDMEVVMGNFLDLPDKERAIASKFILSPMAQVMDKILGQPLFSRMNKAMGDSTLPENAEAPMAPAAPESEGIMAPEETA